MGMPTCMRCAKTVSRDEIGLYKKLVDRTAKEFLCLKCLADAFSCDIQLLRNKIEQLKANGCTLFGPSGLQQNGEG